MQILKQLISNLLICGIVNKMFIILFYKLLSILLAEIAREVFTNTSIQSAQTYLFVHYHNDENQDDLFTSDIESDAEQKFMKAFRDQGGNEAGKEQVRLDVYLTHEAKYAKDLKNNYNLQIKVPPLSDENKKILKGLMESALQNCSGRTT